MEKKMNSKVAIYPGSFDPLTKGHMALVERGLAMFDTIIVAVAESRSKSPLFSLEERVALTREAFAPNKKIQVESFSGLLIDYAQECGVSVVLRGLRAVSDFEYEFQMALMNRKLSKKIQTVFLMSDLQWMYLSSTMIRDVALHGGDVKGLVPECVFTALKERMQNKS